jgi:hypothetical protein
MLAIVLIGSIALFSRTPDPEIVEATVNNGSTQLAAGQPLQLSWQAENADSVTVRVNNQVVLDNQPTSADGVVVNTQGFVSPINVSVVAERDGQESDAETWTLTMTAASTTAEVSITPPTLLRYVSQTAIIRYNIPGATNVSITGLEDALQQPLTIPSGSSGEITAVLLPFDDFTITLSADSSAETTIQESINVQLTDPACSPIGSQAVNLYTQPDTGAGIATTVRPGTRVVVNGRSADGDWLRFAPPSLTTNAWGQTSTFVCDTSFSVDHLREVVADPAVTTSTRTPTIPAPIIVVPRTTTTAGATPFALPTASAFSQQSVPQSTIPQQTNPQQVVPSITPIPGVPAATSLPPLPVTNPTVGVTPASPSN